jgi:hypothetical protein
MQSRGVSYNPERIHFVKYVSFILVYTRAIWKKRENGVLSLEFGMFWI